MNSYLFSKLFVSMGVQVGWGTLHHPLSYLGVQAGAEAMKYDLSIVKGQKFSDN